MWPRSSRRAVARSAAVARLLGICGSATAFTLEADHDVRIARRVVGHAVQGVAAMNKGQPRPLRALEDDPVSLPDHRARPGRRLREVVRTTRGGDVRGEGAVFLDLDDALAIVRIERAPELDERDVPGPGQVARRSEPSGPGRVDRRPRTGDERAKQEGRKAGDGELTHRLASLGSRTQSPALPGGGGGGGGGRGAGVCVEYADSDPRLTGI